MSGSPVTSVQVAPDNSLNLLSYKNAPRGQILRLPLSTPDLAKSKVIVPQSPGVGSDETARAAIESFLPTPGHLYVIDIIGGPSRVRVFDNEGHAVRKIPALPPVSAVAEVVSIGAGDVMMDVSTYIKQPTWYRLENGKSTPTALSPSLPYNFDDAEAVREFACSKDGTHVPLTIIRRKGTPMNGATPALLNGYGGYGISEKPYFAGRTGRLWLDQGGILIFTNIRGGADYGQEWHKNGNLTHKQNVFDDFIACAQHLIERKYTSPAHLAIIGGSNGGLLMGAAFTQHPELFRAVAPRSESTTCCASNLIPTASSTPQNSEP
jgi:prolyl oligopeptidase